MLSSLEYRESWGTVSYSSEHCDMSEQPDTGLEVAFERVENALKNQLNHLRSLGDAVNGAERGEMNPDAIIPKLLLPSSASTKFWKREKLWKEGRRDLYRFMEDFEEKINARSFHRLRASEVRPQHTQNSKILDVPPEGDRGSVMDPISFESPRQVPNPSERYGKRGCFAPAPPSRARAMSPSARPDRIPPVSTVPERNPSLRYSEIRSPSGGVMLFNAPPHFVANMLPEEHVQLAKAKQRESKREQGFEPDLTVRRGLSKTPDSIPMSLNGSYSGSSQRTPRHSRSTSSLKLTAVAEEHSEPPPLAHINTSSPRQTARTQRHPQSVTHHAATRSTSDASNAFYDPPHRGIPQPSSHLPTAIRTSSGLFASHSPEPATTTFRNPDADELKTTQINFVREKLNRDRKKAELQWNEANRMLQGLPAVEGLQEGWTRPRPGSERVSSGEDLDAGDESLGKRIKNLWRNGTKKTANVNLGLRR